jgi:hypothetical protein
MAGVGEVERASLRRASLVQNNALATKLASTTSIAIADSPPAAIKTLFMSSPPIAPVTNGSVRGLTLRPLYSPGWSICTSSKTH